MKKLLPKLWAKIIALLLLAVMTVLLVASVAGVALMIDQNAYVDGGKQMREDVYRSQIYSGFDDFAQFYGYMKQAEKTGSENAYYNQDTFDALYAPENTNLMFTITGKDGDTLSTADGSIVRYSTTESQYPMTLRSEEKTETKTFLTEEERDAYISNFAARHEVLDVDAYTGPEDGTTEAEDTIQYEAIITYVDQTEEIVSMTGAVRQDFTAKDYVAQADFWLEKLLALKDVLIFIALLSLACWIFLFSFLLCSAGHKEGAEGIHLNWADKIPLDLYFCLLLIPGVLAAWPVDAADDSWFIIPFIALAVGAWFLLLMALILSFAARAKAGKWWRNTVIFYVLRWCFKALRWLASGFAELLGKLNLYWQVALVWAALCIFELIFFGNGSIWIVETLLLTLVVFTAALNLRKLQEGGRQLAAGNLNFKVDTNKMLPVFKEHGKNLNSISAGMEKAVDEQMKSERMKTELITNVSHDIKTPLTSIVNYVALLKTLNLQDETARSYIDVLDRQSARLRKLTEDLVEASKASSGATVVEFGPTDVNVLLSQAAGEYEDRMKELNLELILNDSPDFPTIRADGKLLWRVFDNLMSNICKYAMPGTRVYLSSAVQDGKVFVTFKNISRYALNITSDELMERFVRGDASRNTEGSGLGLSIAKSLTELQKGVFQISIDGDLYRADVIFDLQQQA